ncbi:MULTISPECIES: MinD/ParA family protein [unclassified Streptomyces]|uniref:MinD/ParA family ATP-binding protein n=1 Tax=unclassified Streptomyces TaxID=2593676 RepID=UPI001BEA2E52|nr:MULTISPECIES: MinD/ParA family protein [unclassified Streptomyces]MBT2407566.1 MinD/ParA family protein [Streptomyces sp. ISL-21]MBT2606889.1 MinD/ParA family protein [Streptomyces sp. ISL-87]
MPNRENWQGEVLRDLNADSAPPAESAPPAQSAPPAESAPPAFEARGFGGSAPDNPAAQTGPGAQPQFREGAGRGTPPQGPPPTHPHPQPAYQQPLPQQPQPQPLPQQPQPQPLPQQPQPLPQPQPPYQRPQAPAPRTPDSRPVVDQTLAAATLRKPLHGEPLTTRATRAIRRTVSASAAREVAEITRTAEVLQQPVTTGRQIAVTSIRGGAGKSTVTALLGTTYAHYRQDPVLFVEADPALGSLPLRLGAESLRWTTGDVAGIVEPQMSLLDITGYLVQLPGNAWLLPGSQGQIGAMLDTRAYERAMVALRRYFGVTVVDCETLPAEVARVALAAAQARVLTTPATLEGITSTYAVLQWMQGLPKHVIAGTVVVITELAPHPGLNLTEAAQKLKSTGVRVQVLPYDRHLAAGGAIRTELLAHSTREAATRLAAEVFQLSQKRH